MWSVAPSAAAAALLTGMLADEDPAVRAQAAESLKQIAGRAPGVGPEVEAEEP